MLIRKGRHAPERRWASTYRTKLQGAGQLIRGIPAPTRNEELAKPVNLTEIVGVVRGVVRLIIIHDRRRDVSDVPRQNAHDNIIVKGIAPRPGTRKVKGHDRHLVLRGKRRGY